MNQDDMALVREFAVHQTETAFATLVQRHIGLVYSAALRQTGDAQMAEEITQSVFIVLARKAASLGRDTILPSWLYRTTRYSASNAQKIHRRRHEREQEAYMQSTLRTDDTATAWQQLAPLLDDAMAGLAERERASLVLRYFENRPWHEVAELTQVTEDAAQKRGARALEKLRKLFIKRGVTFTVTLIAGAVTANSVQAAPGALAETISAVAAAKGVAASTATLTLVNSALKRLAWAKMKTAVTIGLGILVVIGTTAIATKLNSPPLEIQFQAEGTVTYAMAPDPRGTITNTLHLVVTRMGKLWKIRTITENQVRTGLFGSMKDSVDLYYEMGFDGTNIYRLIQQDTEKILATVPANERDRWVFAQGDVAVADAPPGNDIHQFYSVWLAYCSAPYFQSLPDDKAVSPAYAERDFIGEPIVKMPSSATWSLSGKFFLKDAAWRSDGTFKAYMPDGKETTMKYEPPYNFPFVNGQFTNQTWTNWNGVSIPESFEVTAVRPNYQSTNVAKFVPLYSITGTLDHIRKIEGFSPVPDLTSSTHVTDWRNMRRGQPARFVSTNSWDLSKATHP